MLFRSGLGTGSIAHACADTKKPVKQGMFGIFEVFADTLVICTLTAMVILCSGTPVNYGTAAGAELTISGFTTTYGGWASVFTAVALCCFAFSTIIGWGDKGYGGLQDDLAYIVGEFGYIFYNDDFHKLYQFDDGVHSFALWPKAIPHNKSSGDLAASSKVRKSRKLQYQVEHFIC